VDVAGRREPTRWISREVRDAPRGSGRGVIQCQQRDTGDSWAQHPKGEQICGRNTQTKNKATFPATNFWNLGFSRGGLDIDEVVAARRRLLPPPRKTTTIRPPCPPPLQRPWYFDRRAGSHPDRAAPGPDLGS
jgi:hypothetical protein